MKHLSAVLGYAAGVLTLAAAVLGPFVLFPLFTNGVAATGVKINPIYSAGPVRYQIDRGAYRIAVHVPVRSAAPLGGSTGFVQVVWGPISALPQRVSESLDVDGDSRLDATVTFEIPKDREAMLRAQVVALTPRVRPATLTSAGPITELIARSDDRVFVRVPLAAPER